MQYIVVKREDGQNTVEIRTADLGNAIHFLKTSRMAWKEYPANERPRFWINVKADGKITRLDEDTQEFMDKYEACQAD